MTTIDDYIRQTPEERHVALTRLRELCQQRLVGYTESIEFGMPAYRAPGGTDAEIAFASQKRHLALYLLKESVMDQFRDRFPKSRVGKGCIRYSRVEQIDFDLVDEILQCTLASDSDIC